jgi:predicted nucleotidyltransferase
MNVIEQKLGQVADLCRQYHVQRLALFGSALRDGFEEQSDLDFLVEFEAVPSGTYADTYFGLKESLEQLFQRSVDLVVESAIRNPYFRQSIERSKALLFSVKEATRMVTLPNAL